MTEPKPPRTAAGTVVIVLAIGVVAALNVITVALLWAAVHRLGVDPDSGISDNGVQILLAWGGGIISVIAGYTGYAVGERKNRQANPPDEPLPQGQEPPQPDLHMRPGEHAQTPAVVNPPPTGETAVSGG